MADKSKMSCNKPVSSDRPGKKKMVKACDNGQEKLIHFGADGYKHNYSAEAKKSFRARHGCDDANDKLSAKYWACKNLWPKNKNNFSEGGVVQEESCGCESCLEKEGIVDGPEIVKGDSEKNDVVKANLSAGEMVIPKSVVAKGPEAIAKFAEKELSRVNMATGGLVEDDIETELLNKYSTISSKQEALPKKKYSEVESAIKGAVQGGTAGFGEEIGAGFGSLLELLPGSSTRQDEELRKKYPELTIPESPTYTSMRDELRAENIEAKKQNPKSYLLGEIGGGLATAAPLGAVANTAKGAAAIGAASGLGYSDADLTKGKVGQAAIDTTIGGLAGAGFQQALKRAPKASLAGGAVGGTIGALTSEDPLEGALMGTGAGIIVGAGAEGARQLAKGITKGTTKIAKDLLPTISGGIQRGLEPNAPTASEFTQRAIVELNAVTDELDKAAQGRINLTQQELKDLTVKKIQLEDTLLKQKSESVLAQQRASGATAEAKALETEMAKIQKNSEDLIKLAEKSRQDEIKIAQKALDEERNSQLEVFKKQKEQKEQLVKDMKNSQDLEEQQAFQDLIAETAVKQTKNLDDLKLNLKKEYQVLQSDLDKNGIVFDVNEIANGLDSELQKVLTPEQYKTIGNELNAIIERNAEGGSALNLGQFKSIQATLRRLSNKAPSEVEKLGYSKVLQLSKKYVDNKVSTLSNETKTKLNNLDNDWYFFNDVSDNLFEESKNFGALKDANNLVRNILPNSQGIVPSTATNKMADVQGLVSNFKTPEGLKFTESLLGDLEAAKQLALQKVKNKGKSPDILKEQSELSRLESLVEEFKGKAKVNEAPLKTPQEVSENVQKIEELKALKQDLDSVKSRSDDEYLQIESAKVETEKELSKLQNLINEFKEREQTRLSKIESSVEQKYNEVDRKKAIQDTLTKYVQDSPDLENQEIKRYVDQLSKEANLSPERLKRALEDRQFLKQVKGKQGEGSLSDRALALKLGTKLAYSGARGVGKVRDSIVNSKPGQVVERMYQKSAEFGKTLDDALKNGEDKFRATLNSLLQSNENFRKIYNEEK